VRAGVAYHPARLRAEARDVAALVTDDPWSAQFRVHAGDGSSGP
jgi:hypothetical protein